MSLQSRYRFTAAWLPGGWRRNVVISVDPAGDIVDVSPDDVVTTARLVSGAAIPGMPNVHSHAFQRSMAGLAERRTSHGDSFWTWRETMYEHASRMSPECLNAVAAQCYADMLKAGYTAVCEFHYLHNQADGTPYAERATMCQALIDAAATAGIGLTLLPTLYQTADFGGAPPTPRQRQFVLTTDQYLDLIDELSRAHTQSLQVEIGVALHSLRAVPPDALRTVLTALPAIKTIHIHIAEQEREVAAAQQHLGARPIEWLMEHARVDRRWCLVHATHSTHAELKAVAASSAVIALCPTTEANLGDGHFPLPSWVAAGGAFAIGSDSHISLSPCRRVAVARVPGAAAQQASQCARDRQSSVERLDAVASGVLCRHASDGSQHGAVEAGRRADIVVIDTNGPLFVGREDDELMDTLSRGRRPRGARRHGRGPLAGAGRAALRRDCATRN